MSQLELPVPVLFTWCSLNGDCPPFIQIYYILYTLRPVCPRHNALDEVMRAEAVGWGLKAIQFSSK
jgi:hypothetical protein